MNPHLEWWFKAKAERVGLILMTSDRPRLMNALWAARQGYERPEDLADLSICTSPTSEHELWIVHKVVRIEDAEA